MKYIRSVRKITPDKPNGRTIVYMLGYGGYAWQAKRHLNLLKNRGYEVVAIDFTFILRTANPQSLIDLIDETAEVLKNEQLINKETLIVSVSLGGLVGYNLLKRYAELTKLLIITGGDITHLPTKRSLEKKWKLKREELSRLWQEVNIYTPVGQLNGKHIIMLLPSRDKMIDPGEVINEIARHAGHNNIQLITKKGGHFRTIISETIISPKKSLQLIEQLERF